MEEILAEEEFTVLNKFVVGSVPTVYYIPEYVTAAEEELLLNNVSSVVPKFVHCQISMPWLAVVAVFCRFTKLRFPSGNHWRTEGYKIGVLLLIVRVYYAHTLGPKVLTFWNCKSLIWGNNWLWQEELCTKRAFSHKIVSNRQIIYLFFVISFFFFFFTCFPISA